MLLLTVPQVTDEKALARFKSAFSFFDINGDGQIERVSYRLHAHITHIAYHRMLIAQEELHLLMNSLGMNPTDEQIVDLVGQVDNDENGTVSFEEFIPLLARLLSRAMKSNSDLIHIQKMASDQMTHIRELLAKESTCHRSEKLIKKVALIVVVAEEVEPVIQKFNPVVRPDLTAEFLNLADVYSCTMTSPNSAETCELFLLRVAHSSIFKRHYSGYTQSSAISALAVKVIDPDIIVSFGTAGGNPNLVEVGEAVIANGCVFADRFRTSNKNAFDWGVFAGPTMPSDRLIRDLNMRTGLLGSQMSYGIDDVQVNLIDTLGILFLDMEAAAEAEICHQTKTNFITLKMISNGVYPGNPTRMEEDYVSHKAEVSRKGTEALSALLQYFVGKKCADLQ
jgi:nucleoside phosphorylase